ncbi:hypothetical protein DFJ74DRAFT_771527 [Hyaloraphidium curvatum]|nr:hypothetical protein DFJ74DRAFT_771527 [Hyaloraphidium curvatum]
MHPRGALLALLALAALPAARAESMAAIIARVNAANDSEFDFTLNQFAEWAPSYAPLQAALAGPPNSATVFAFTDEAWTNQLENDEYDFAALYGYDPRTNEQARSGLMANHLVPRFLPADAAGTYDTALTAAHPSKLTTLDAQTVSLSPAAEGDEGGVRSGLTYSLVARRFPADQGTLVVVSSMLAPYPSVARSLKDGGLISGDDSASAAAFAARLPPTDGYPKCTVLAPLDSAWTDFLAGPGSALTPAQVDQVVRYHVIPDPPSYVLQPNLPASTRYRTLQGDPLERTVSPLGQFFGVPGAVTGAEDGFSSEPNSWVQPAIPDSGAANGVIQLLDSVLVPEALRSFLVEDGQPDPTESGGELETTGSPVPTGTGSAAQTTGTLGGSTVRTTGTLTTIDRTTGTAGFTTIDRTTGTLGGSTVRTTGTLTTVVRTTGTSTPAASSEIAALSTTTFSRPAGAARAASAGVGAAVAALVAALL